MNTLKIFDTTKEIIEKSEANILNYESDNRFILYFNKHIVFPIKYVMLGSSDFFKPFIKWFFLFFVMLLIVSYFVKNVSFPSELIVFLYTIIMFGTLMLVIFSVPSTYAYFGIKNENVIEVMDILKNNQITTLHELEVLESNIDIIYDRVLARINAFKWVVGAYWIYFTFSQNQKMSIAKQFDNKDFIQFIITNMGEIALTISITIIAIWLISSYKRASDFLFKSISFGINEYKYLLTKELPNKTLEEKQGDTCENSSIKASKS